MSHVPTYSTLVLLDVSNVRRGKKSSDETRRNWYPLRPEMLYIGIEGALVLMNTNVM